MMPMVACQTLSGYVDLFGTAALFGSLALVLEYCDQLHQPERTAQAALLTAAGLGCGLALGAKPVFWLYSLLLFLTTFFLLKRKDGLSTRTWLRFGLFSAGIAAPAIFWFVRAMVCSGNPLFPIAIHAGPFSLPGIAPSSIASKDYYLIDVQHSAADFFVYPWTEWKRHTSFLLVNYTEDHGLGAAFATFVAPGLIFSAWLAVKRRPDLRVWLFHLALLGILWWFALYKLMRYGLPIIVLVVLLSAPFFEILEARATRFYRFLYVLALALTAAILAFEPAYTISQTWRSRDWSRATYLAYPPVIDTLKPGSALLNLGDPTLNFPLAGSHLTNRVIPNWEAPSSLTADFLRSRQVEYVVQRFSHEKDKILPEPGPPVEGLDLYFRASVMEGESIAEWRIWRTH
jgi:hypothetical protein